MAIDIVDLPINSMVIIPSSLCHSKKKTEGFLDEPTRTNMNEHAHPWSKLPSFIRWSVAWSMGKPWPMIFTMRLAELENGDFPVRHVKNHQRLSYIMIIHVQICTREFHCPIISRSLIIPFYLTISHYIFPIAFQCAISTHLTTRARCLS